MGKGIALYLYCGSLQGHLIIFMVLLILSHFCISGGKYDSKPPLFHFRKTRFNHK